MSRHTVCCSIEGCPEPASYKVAARWSDGGFEELKTYGFACSEHLGEVFREARRRRRDYPTAPGESVEEPAIYHYEAGKRDRQLQRVRGLEDDFGS